MTAQERNLETYEIRGITPKIIAWIIGSTVTICLSIGGVYVALQVQLTKFQDHAVQQDKDIDANSGRINTLDLKYDDHNKRIYLLEAKK